MIRILLRDLVDYAGLFPPAALPMPAAVANYAAYRSGPHAYALSRFIVTAPRLEELETSLPADIDYPWRVSVLLSGNLEGDLAAIGAFNTRQENRAEIDTVEVRCQSPDQIEAFAQWIPESLTSYFEFPVTVDPAPFVAAIAAAKQRAKIRTGGVTADAFPRPAEIVRFLAACANQQVAFKATAGLHHPLFCQRPLTYSPDSPEGWMYGFLNLFLAASWISLGLDPKAIAPLLEVQETGDLAISDADVRWRVFRLTAADLESVRQRFAISFGSCSFDEPIADLQSLGLLNSSH